VLLLLLLLDVIVHTAFHLKLLLRLLVRLDIPLVLYLRHLCFGGFHICPIIDTEHDVIPRNLERHRREALTMERLTSSPYVINLYAYCGNSILTEYASQDLSAALGFDANEFQNKKKIRKKKQHNDDADNDQNNAHRRNHHHHHHHPYHSDQETSDMETARLERELGQDQDHKDYPALPENHIPTTIYNVDDKKILQSTWLSSLSSSSSSSLTKQQRLDLLFQAAKAIQALHQNDIIHADLTAKQFLVIHHRPTNHNNKHNHTNSGNELQQQQKIQLKINDFNRCRFVPHVVNDTLSSSTTTAAAAANKCAIQIPSAPGLYRSPEEYAGKFLTPQIDIFSLGHVLFEIWTGTHPWEDSGGKRIKTAVQEGLLPPGLQRMLSPEDDRPGEDASLDKAVAQLIADCYQVDPKQRITADTLVDNLSQLIHSVGTKDDASF
jgi:serine/threonine protein kinase